MKIVNVNVPEEFIKKAIAGELNSYSYNSTTKSIMFLHDFNYNERGEVIANVESYLIDSDSELVGYFTEENPIIPGMKIINADNIESIDKMAEMMTKLMEFCESRPCFKTATSVFSNIDTPTSTVREDYSDNDIIVKLPDAPIKFSEEGLE